MNHPSMLRIATPCALLLAAQIASAQTPPPGWTLVWQDEFNTPTLNPANWRAENAALVKNNEQQYYAPSNVTIANGVLTILSERRAQGGRPYTSGLIESKDRKFQAFGRYEFRAKLPGTRGLWPAIWMLPQSGVWPPEIDIMELLGHEPNKVYMTHHWGTAAALQSQSDFFIGPDFTAAYHDFALEWFPDRLDYFVDGVLRAHQTTSIPRNPMYLIVNTAVGGDWPGNPNVTTVFPQRLLLDYVRVYRRNLANESFEDFGPAGNVPLYGWSTFGNTFAEPVSARSGARSGKMFGNFTGAANVSGMTQDADVQPGQRWRLSSFWHNRSDDRMQGANSAVLKMEWYSAAGALLGSRQTTALTAASPTNVFLPVGVTDTAPAGAARVRVALLFLQPANAPGAAFVDDILLEQVACPADFNSDGAVDPDDLSDFIGCFFAFPPCAGADFNADGAVDPDDLSDFIGAFFANCL